MKNLFLTLKHKISTKIKIPNTITSDLSNILAYQNTFHTPTMSCYQKFIYFSPTNLYYYLDHFYKELVFTLAHDFHLGIPASIIFITLSIKGIFLYPYIKSQIMTLKQKQIKPYYQVYAIKRQRAFKNKKLIQQAKKQYNNALHLLGIDFFYSNLHLLRHPIFITWFFSIFHMTTHPLQFPSITQSLFWIPNISTYDPFFILPLVTTLLARFSIPISPWAQTANSVNIPYIQHFKYLPFVFLPIIGFFPAIINLYFLILSANQAAMMFLLNTQYMNKIIFSKTIPPPKQFKNVPLNTNSLIPQLPPNKKNHSKSQNLNKKK